MQTIRFYFDYISSNAYLAWTQLHALAQPYGFAIDPVPVLFAGLLEAHGQLGPAEVPAKALWMVRRTRMLSIRGVYEVATTRFERCADAGIPYMRTLRSAVSP